VGFGAKDVLEQSCINLPRKIDVCLYERHISSSDVKLELLSLIPIPLMNLESDVTCLLLRYIWMACFRSCQS